MRISSKLGCVTFNLFTLLIVATWMAPAQACGGLFRGRRQACGRVAYAPCYQPQPVPIPYPCPVPSVVTPPAPLPTPPVKPTPAPIPKPSPQTATEATEDPYGFVVWLNAERAQRRLNPVAWDKYCEYNAYVNNQWQAAKGMNHWHHVCRHQNAGAMGPGSATWIAWAGHGPHADALFDPSITVVGLHVMGQYQTYNAN
jgi:hypothetical protein